MNGPSSRRGFLRGLTTLPLIGGGVVLTGNPTAAAAPITPGLLATYSAWLYRERQFLMWASCKAGPDAGDFIPCLNPATSFHSREDGWDAMAIGRRAQERAAVILSAAGCPLTSEEAENQWRTVFRIGAEVVQ